MTQQLFFHAPQNFFAQHSKIAKIKITAILIPMTLMHLIEAGRCPVFDRICRQVGENNFPPFLTIPRHDWLALQAELHNHRFALRNGMVMGVPIHVAK